jgi:hypothetical protein
LKKWNRTYSVAFVQQQKYVPFFHKAHLVVS